MPERPRRPIVKSTSRPLDEIHHMPEVRHVQHKAKLTESFVDGEGKRYNFAGIGKKSDDPVFGKLLGEELWIGPDGNVYCIDLDEEPHKVINRHQDEGQRKARYVPDEAAITRYKALKKKQLGEEKEEGLNL